VYFPGEKLWNKEIKKKVCLLGEGAVGKTSLIRRYVVDQFDDAYIVTVGTKVTKKELVVPDSGGVLTKMDMTVWDIMGQPGFREILKQSYFHGASGIIAICDVTRMETYEALESWIADVRGIVGEKVPVVFFGNKNDLDEKTVTEEDMNVLATKYNTVAHLTSAKTGDGVEDGFLSLAKQMLK